MTCSPLWQDYSREVLAWQLGTEAGPDAGPDAECCAAAAQGRAAAAAQRLLRMSAASGRPHVLLLGLGDGQCAALLQEALPPGLRLYILESSPHKIRRIQHDASPLWQRLLPHLMVDTSPWALLLLTQAAGLTPDNCTLGWGEKTLGGAPAVLEQWRRLFLSAQCCPLPCPLPPLTASAHTPRISVAAILHPAEPHLPEFFAHIPSWVHEVCVVWDTGTAPPLVPCAAPLRSCVRPLDNDFAAQRNTMLDLCTGDWCFYLDADERLLPEDWAALPSLAALAELDRPTVRSVLFPRLTFEGDESRVRMGYGLWPDVQRRLLPLTPGLRFAGSIHEHVVGIADDILLAPGIPLWHYSHIHKNRTQVEEKLRVFNQAAGQSLHQASAAYPSLPTARMAAVGAAWGRQRVVRLHLHQG